MLYLRGQTWCEQAIFVRSSYYYVRPYIVLIRAFNLKTTQPRTLFQTKQLHDHVWPHRCGQRQLHRPTHRRQRRLVRRVGAHRRRMGDCHRHVWSFPGRACNAAVLLVISCDVIINSATTWHITWHHHPDGSSCCWYCKTILDAIMGPKGVMAF